MLSIHISKWFMRTKKLPHQHYDFLKLTTTPTGSQIPISIQEKEKINKQIDQKMQQLEDTGLSREQILLSKSPKGIPLAIDPFFQFLKNNKLAREVYLRRSERFSAERVIDIALRQNIGRDSSYSGIKTKKILNDKGRVENLENFHDRQSWAFDPKTYNANSHTNMYQLYEELKPTQPLMHVYKPINKFERDKARQRKLKKYDIHWRNVQLLRQFLTPYGNIKSAVANNLSYPDQRKVSKAIKTARANYVIPHYGKFFLPNKRNLTNIEDQVQEIGLHNVNLRTGHLYVSRPQSLDNLEVETSYQRDADKKYQFMKNDEEYKLWLEQRDQKTDEDFVNAERYAKYLKKEQNKEKQKNKLQREKMTLTDLTGLVLRPELATFIEGSDSIQCQEAFEKRKKNIEKRILQNPLKITQIIVEQKTL